MIKKCILLALSGILLSACAAPVSGKIANSSFHPQKILVAALFGNESDRGTASFEDTLSQGLQACHIEHKSIYNEKKASPTLSLSDTDLLFEQTIRSGIENYEPDALLEVTLISTSHNPGSILTADLVGAHYAIHLTALPSRTAIWQGSASNGDVLGIDTRARLAQNIIDELKKDGAIQCPSEPTP